MASSAQTLPKRPCPFSESAPDPVPSHISTLSSEHTGDFAPEADIVSQPDSEKNAQEQPETATTPQKPRVRLRSQLMACGLLPENI